MTELKLVKMALKFTGFTVRVKLQSVLKSTCFLVNDFIHDDTFAKKGMSMDLCFNYMSYVSVV